MLEVDQPDAVALEKQTTLMGMGPTFVALSLGMALLESTEVRMVARSMWGSRHSANAARVGTMEPTTVIALRTMEKSGLIRRVRSTDDKRRSHVWLTPKAQQLRTELLTLARGITDAAEAGIGRGDLALFRRVIARMTANLDRIKT